MHWTTGKSAFDFCQKQEIFILFIVSRLFSHEVKQLWHDADQLLLSTTIKNALSDTSILLFFFMACCLINHMNNFITYEHKTQNSSVV